MPPLRGVFWPRTTPSMIITRGCPRRTTRQKEVVAKLHFLMLGENIAVPKTSFGFEV
jgi:hypothetical protein